MDAFEKQYLEDWRRGNLTEYEVKRYIKYLEGNRDRDKARLEKLQAYVAQHYIGYDEWADRRIFSLQQEIDAWNEWIAFAEWLLNEPKYEMILPLHKL